MQIISETRAFNEETYRALVNTAPYYSRASFKPQLLRRHARRVARKLDELRAEAIVVIGHSGLIMGGAASLISGVPVFSVRKKDDGWSHSPGSALGVAENGPVERWVFLDDFVASGASFRRAASQVFEYDLVSTPLPVAILEYNSGVNGKLTVADYWREEIAPTWPRWGEWVGKTIPQLGVRTNEGRLPSGAR